MAARKFEMIAVSQEDENINSNIFLSLSKKSLHYRRDKRENDVYKETQSSSTTLVA